MEPIWKHVRPYRGFLLTVLVPMAHAMGYFLTPTGLRAGHARPGGADLLVCWGGPAARGIS
jgi:hypothetical protein